jgi:hypothetical protein
MSTKDYVPGNDREFSVWSKTLLDYAQANYAAWGVSAPNQALVASVSDFEVRLQKMDDPNRGKIDVIHKNEARKAAEKGMRNYVQGFLARNPSVTAADKEAMGLPVYDTIPTPVGDPVGLVTATVKYVNVGALELSINHVEGSPYDQRANYGVKIRYGVFSGDVLPVEEVSRLTESRFSRRKRELFTFDRKDSGKTACFCLRYENSKGKSGQWGPVVSAVIP